MKKTDARNFRGSEESVSPVLFLALLIPQKSDPNKLLVSLKLSAAKCLVACDCGAEFADVAKLGT